MASECLPHAASSGATVHLWAGGRRRARFSVHTLRPAPAPCRLQLRVVVWQCSSL